MSYTAGSEVLLTRNRALLVTSLLVALVGGYFVWDATSRLPLYWQSHRHSTDGQHDHMHSHANGMDHGHDHIGLVGNQTHSHPHQHGHQHGDQLELAAEKGLTLIGHTHHSDEIVQYFANATVTAAETLHLNFLRSSGSELIPAECSNERIGVLIYNGTQLESRLIAKQSDRGFSGDLPPGFFCLPSHTARFENISLDSKELSAVVPLLNADREVSSDH